LEKKSNKIDKSPTGSDSELETLSGKFKNCLWDKFLDTMPRKEIGEELN
jgi:hypothetical protein